MTHEPANETSATARLARRIAEQKTNGLIEMSFYPGADREISREDAARVALAMLAHADAITPGFMTSAGA